MRKRMRWALPVAILGLVCALVTIAVFNLAMERSRDNARATLRLVTASLEGHLARYEALPALVADRPELVGVLQAPGDPERREAANRYLADLARRLSISDAYVMLPDGETVAASNHDAISFVGENFRYRPYFQDAAEGRQGRFFGLGTTSNKRGYYFSDPVRVDGTIAGILTFKIDLDPIEASWVSSDTEIVVLDPENIVFMAGRPEWRFRIFGPADAAALERSQLVRRYANEPVRPLDIASSIAYDTSATVRIESNGGARDYQTLSAAMPGAGWTVLVLADTAPARREALTAGLALFLLLALAFFLAAAARSRARRLRERETAELRAKERLEAKVEDRTRELGEAVGRLKAEIGERQSAEETLRRTQDHLVEAGKLAALGQMSAALSHEFNQPLAAARAYADNAALFLDRGAHGKAIETLGRVAELLSRLSSISRNLRNFARRPEDELTAVDAGVALRDALEIVGHRLKAVDAALVIAPGLDGLQVRAVAIRLQQVLVNLLANAADAVEDRTRRRIDVGSRALGDGRVALLVEDTGPGVPAAITARIFDPFFTSKPVGKGLGLGLSISYNIVSDFGGQLRVERGEDGGTRFVIELSLAGEPLRAAAE